MASLILGASSNWRHRKIKSSQHILCFFLIIIPPSKCLPSQEPADTSKWCHSWSEWWQWIQRLQYVSLDSTLDQVNTKETVLSQAQGQGSLNIFKQQEAPGWQPVHLATGAVHFFRELMSGPNATFFPLHRCSVPKRKSGQSDEMSKTSLTLGLQFVGLL